MVEQGGRKCGHRDPKGGRVKPNNVWPGVGLAELGFGGEPLGTGAW